MNEEAAVLRQVATMNILIVDDEPSIRETCADVAKQSGMKAITVATAEEAMEVLENSAVDIVLTDLMLQQENQLLREQLRTRPGFGGLIGLSERMQRVYKIIQKVGLHEYPVLILGESGTGKELVAKSVHVA